MTFTEQTLRTDANWSHANVTFQSEFFLGAVRGEKMSICSTEYCQKSLQISLVSSSDDLTTNQKMISLEFSSFRINKCKSAGSFPVILPHFW